MNDSNPNKLKTYILQNGNRYYVGKTNDLDRRMYEHEKDRWSNYGLVWSIEGDYERRIKSFGVGKFFRTLNKGLLS